MPLQIKSKRSAK